MGPWLTITVTIFDVIWLSGVFILLWLIWRNSSTHTRKLEKTLIDVAMMDAESARKAIDSNRDLIETVHGLIALVQKDRSYDSR
jgi:hypothetical protein